MKIEAVDVRIVDVPLVRPLQMSFALVQQQSYVVVRITAGGITGTGESAGIAGPTWGYECAETIKPVIDGYLAPLLIGRDATNLRALQQRMDKAVTGHPAAKSAIDGALHDLRARALGLDLADLLGGALRTGIPIAWTLASGSVGGDVDSAREMLARRRHRHFKIKIGARAPAEDVRHVAKIREALPADATLRVDLNQAWDESTAARWLPALESVGVELVEQPVARWNHAAMKRLADALTVPIMADESVDGLPAAFGLARDHAADVFSLKVCNLGGISNTLKVAGIAEASGVHVYGGTMLDSPIGTAAALHVFATLPQLPFGCELLGPWLLRDSLTQQPLQIADYELQVPQGPGIGVEVDEDKLRHYSRA